MTLVSCRHRPRYSHNETDSIFQVDVFMSQDGQESRATDRHEAGVGLTSPHYAILS